MIHEESEGMSFRVSQLEKNFKGIMKTLHLCNLEEIMEKKLEESMERIVNLIQNIEEKLLNGDDVGQGTHRDRNSSHFEKPSFSKHTPREFDSNNGSNQGWLPRGIQLPNIDMRMFDGKEPITCIFQMDKYVDLHHVLNLHKVTIPSLYLDPEQLV